MTRFRGDLPERAFQFAKRILGVIDRLPNDVRGWTVAKQLIRKRHIDRGEPVGGCRSTVRCGVHTALQHRPEGSGRDALLAPPLRRDRPSQSQRC